MIDAHVHIWNRARADYGWLARSPFASLPWRAEVDDLDLLAEERGIVLVEAGADGADSEILWEASTHPRVMAVVPALPATAEELGRMLERDERGVVGAIRWQAQRVPADTPFSVRELAGILQPALAVGLGVEIVAGRARAREATVAALNAGAERVLVDHLAGVPRDRAELSGWRTDLDTFGALGAVTLKLSGMRSASRVTLDPLVAETLERIPPERLMWGSDWPVAGLDGASRGELLAATGAALAAAGLTDDQSVAVLHGTATDWYRLTA